MGCNVAPLARLAIPLGCTREGGRVQLVSEEGEAQVRERAEPVITTRWGDDVEELTDTHVARLGFERRAQGARDSNAYLSAKCRPNTRRVCADILEDPSEPRVRVLTRPVTARQPNLRIVAVASKLH